MNFSSPVGVMYCLSALFGLREFLAKDGRDRAWFTLFGMDTEESPGAVYLVELAKLQDVAAFVASLTFPLIPRFGQGRLWEFPRRIFFSCVKLH